MLKKVLKASLLGLGAITIAGRLLEYFANKRKISIVGGADGPTAIYISTKKSSVLERVRKRLQGEEGENTMLKKILKAALFLAGVWAITEY